MKRIDPNLTKQKMVPFAIYVFDDGRVIYAVGRAKIGDFDEMYGAGFELVADDDKDKRLNTKTKIRERARKSVVTSVSNVLNVLIMYGEGVLDDRRQVVWDKVRDCEYLAARTAVKYSLRLEQFKQLRTFKTVDISYMEAEKNGLI